MKEEFQKQHRAIKRADIRLRKMHAKDYRDLLNQERAKLGMPPIGARRPGGPARRS